MLGQESHTYITVVVFLSSFSSAQSYVFEIVLTLECAVDHSNMEIEDEEDGPQKIPTQQRASLPTSQSHSQLQSYDSSFFQQQQHHQQQHQQQHQQFQQQQQHQQQLQQQQQQQLVIQPPTSSSLASPSSNSTTQITRKPSEVSPLPSGYQYKCFLSRFS